MPALQLKVNRLQVLSEFDDLGQDEGDRASILIVDDLPDKLLVFTTVLEDLGHDLVCVLSGAEALKEVLKREIEKKQGESAAA